MPTALTNNHRDDHRYSFSRIRRLLAVLSGLVLLGALAVVGWSSLRDYHETLHTTENELDVLTLSVDEHIARTMEGSQRTLQQIREDGVFRSCVAGRDRACLHAFLKGQSDINPLFNSLAVIDEEGLLLGSSLQHPVPAFNVSQLPYFRNARARPERPFVLGEYQPDPSGQRDGLQFGVPLLNRDGSFGGVLVAGINQDELQRFFASVSRKPGVIIRMFRDDGVTLARFPPDNADLGRSIAHMDFFADRYREQPSGVQYETGKVDQINRLMAWRKVNGWPLGVLLTLETERALQPWYEEIAINLGVAVLLCVGALALLVYLFAQLRRMERTEADLYLTKVAVERGADMAIWLDMQGHIRYVNATASSRLGYSERELLDMRFRDINPEFHPDSWPKFWQHLREKKHLFDELELCTRAGEIFPVEAYSNYVQFNGEEYNCAVVRDISERRLAEQAVIKSEQQLRLALEASNTGLFDLPLEGRRAAITSPEYDRMLGYQPGELAETFDKWKDQVHPQDREQTIGALRDYFVGNSTQFAVEYRRRLKSGEYRWFLSRGRFVEFDYRGKPTRLIGTMTDITERKEAQERITELANFDLVTGLANRNLLRDELRLALAAAERFGRHLAVLFLDLDRFKTINDSLGHTAGDMVLSQVASRLRAEVGKADILARLGGDEFVVVLTDIAGPLAASAIADRILASFAVPFELEAGGFASSTSIGISIFPDDGADADTLIRNADVAMYQAKASGRGNYQFFTADMNTRASERLVLETSMRRGLVQNEFVLYFQPQASLEDGRIVGAEALIRWQHPEQGMIPPGKFIPVAEESRLIVPLGSWVLEEACRHAASWVAKGLPPLTVAVNLSPMQFSQPGLVQQVRDCLERYGLPPERLELEVTESVVMQDVDQVAATLDAFNALGVKLSIDDFGTGYSSLSYLKRFAFDKLKVDQSFVRDLSDDPNDTAIVLAIIGLGKTLGMSVLAEGVETQAQLKFLREAETDSIQGFLFSRPVPEPDFVELVRSQARLPLM
ncbi:bifunctional diguanylate cyclase/phosphodiesterase [Chitinilyticum piscinae]|uniref:EAL domain-containing protein n=1 Tax=Chitinilyticum piscinae TaxID=2866724 RepID=A0A8J7FLU2_9NEIS|nr:EAL domain-containing protein [Chitinilyticum piscinae]MBE9610457.1 EAL domain-containing protein [Chitinilyticum piscinae]